ncbi:Low-affinity glucose transporter HXT1 [Colletotrichum siamense]|uniref:Low-affinity glucose transporter HXT1 n=1 Tax=Colletotrichum siamense TaxID=690259 RepID=A0A9P5F2K4_COLSI|nr:Low-affinity glucose transporter HXT1 [Colletotrichum siamense]KAF4864443.1 Low-affinity glucose transporter HXT1 [Colletotrichum siamense]
MSLRNTWAHYKWAIFYCAVSAIGALCYGYDNTYYNGVLAMQEFKNDYGNIRDTDGKLALSSSFQSVTASAIYIGDLLGAIIAAPLNDRYGRKSTFWLASFCIFIGGICQVADTLSSEGLLVVGRILIGLGVGQFTVTSLLYIGEVAPPSVRGPALMCFQFLQSWSQLCASAINQGTQNIKSSLGYRIPMGGLVVLPLIMAALLPFIPESPLWYVLKGRRTEAEQSFRKINQSKPSYDPSEDMATAENAKSIEEQHAEFSSWGSLITDPIERRKLTYSAGAMFSQQICGILFFYVYGVVFVHTIGLGDPFLVQLITNIVQIFAVGASVMTANRVRRRVNLMITNFMMLVAFIIIGGVSIKPLTSSTQYVIVVFSFVVVVGFNFGLGPLAYTVAREMAVGPNQNKIMSASIVIFYLTTWVVSFTAPYLYYDAGLGPMVGFVYAGTTCLSILWTWFCVGETAGRSSLEISMFFAEKVPVRAWRRHMVSDTPSLREMNSDDKSKDMRDVSTTVEHQEFSV